jgi:hypothetical protein
VSSKAQFESAALLPAGWLTPEAFAWRPQEAAEFESAALLPAGWLTPEAFVWRPQEAAEFESAARLPEGWAMPEAPRAAGAPELARSSAEAAVQARRLAGPAASAEQAVALPPGEPVA